MPRLPALHVAAALAALCLCAGAGEAQTKRRGRHRVDVGKLSAELAAHEIEVARRAAAELAKAATSLGPPDRREASAAVSGVLAVGVSPALAIDLLGTYAALKAAGLEAENAGKNARRQRKPGKQPKQSAAVPTPEDGGAATVHLYLQHRRPRVRVAALRAVATAGGRESEKHIIAALSDFAPEVRAAAARLVAEHRIERGVESLLLLLQRGDEAVIEPLATLADADVAQAVMALVDKVPDALVSRALGAMLLQSKFGPEATRVEVVQVLARVPGSEAVEALSAYVAATPDKPPRDSRKEAEEAVEKRIAAGGE